MKKISTILARQLRAQGKKRCPRCEITKDLKEFGTNNRGRDFGVTPYCINCKRAKATERRIKYPQEWKKYYTTTKGKTKARDYRLKYLFGLSLEEYNALLMEQNYVCCICKTGEQDGDNLSVDHNHATGAVRGLLCKPCNSAIGLLKEDKTVVLAAYNYLLKNDSST